MVKKVSVREALMDEVMKVDPDILGYDLIMKAVEAAGVGYSNGKRVLQELRTEGVVVVTKDGPPGRASWVAHQRFSVTQEVWEERMASVEGPRIQLRVAALDVAAKVQGGVRRVKYPLSDAVVYAVEQGWVQLRVGPGPNPPASE